MPADARDTPDALADRLAAALDRIDTARARDARAAAKLAALDAAVAAQIAGLDALLAGQPA